MIFWEQEAGANLRGLLSAFRRRRHADCFLGLDEKPQGERRIERSASFRHGDDVVWARLIWATVETRAPRTMTVFEHKLSAAADRSGF